MLFHHPPPYFWAHLFTYCPPCHPPSTVSLDQRTGGPRGLDIVHPYLGRERWSGGILCQCSQFTRLEKAEPVCPKICTNRMPLSLIQLKMDGCVFSDLYFIRPGLVLRRPGGPLTGIC